MQIGGQLLLSQGSCFIITEADIISIPDHNVEWVDEMVVLGSMLRIDLWASAHILRLMRTYTGLLHVLHMCSLLAGFHRLPCLASLLSCSTLHAWWGMTTASDWAHLSCLWARWNARIIYQLTTGCSVPSNSPVTRHQYNLQSWHCNFLLHWLQSVTWASH